MPNGGAEISGEQVIIQHVTRHHAGIYIYKLIQSVSSREVEVYMCLLVCLIRSFKLLIKIVLVYVMTSDFVLSYVTRVDMLKKNMKYPEKISTSCP